MNGIVKVYINGVYYEPEFYEYDSSNNVVIWKKTIENNFEAGFNVSIRDRVTIEYNVDVSENGLENIYQVI